MLLEGGIVVRFLVIILHVPNGCPGETELMCVPVGVLAEHAVVKYVDCVEDLSSLGHNVGLSVGCSQIPAVLWKLRNVAAVCY